MSHTKCSECGVDYENKAQVIGNPRPDQDLLCADCFFRERDPQEEIDRLRAENARLREALKPFADAWERMSPTMRDYGHGDICRANWTSGLTRDDLERARAALDSGV